MSQANRSNNGSRLGRLAPLASLLTLAACSSLLGIEELHEGPTPGGGTGAESGAESAGRGGASGAGKGGSAGKAQGGNNNSNAGTVGDTAGEAGVAGDGTTQGGSGNGGSAGSVGGSAGKAGGSGGNGGSAGKTGGSSGNGGSGGSVGGTTVTGHVIDYWGHQLSGIPVEIGGTKVTTDAQGAFTIPNVAAQYDASLIVKVADTAETAGWVFQGLTRRDPTLQVYLDLVSHSQYLDVEGGAGLTTALTGSRTFSVAVAGPDGQDEFKDVKPDNFTEGHPSWRGPTTTQETAYGLVWQPDANGLPSSYVAFDSKTLALNSGSSSNALVTFDMTPGTINASAISGTVTPGGSSERENWAFVQFPTNAAITVARDKTGANTFSYLAPALTGSSMVFCATEGDAYTGGYALVHKDGLAPGTTGITAKLPLPASGLAVSPAADSTKVSSTTVFSFQPGTGSTGPFLLEFDNLDASSMEHLLIVTAKTSFTLPKVVNDTYALLPGQKYYWRVQTHGVFANVDAMAGTTGYLDEFSGTDYLYGFPSPAGPRHGDGAFTISANQNITLAP
ncbi:MAG TPA: hypothetical protein VER96_10515 [Polyangiaceae bacterium]|nr:hypothetical protein [Polyangiaceae bacterium]